MSEIDEPIWSTDAFRQFIEKRIPFNELVGMKVAHLERGRAVLVVPFRKQLIGDIFRPAIHGGVMSSLIDATGGAAVFTMVEVQDRVSTVDLRVDYLRPGAEEQLTAEAQVMRMGNRVAVVQATVHQGDPDEPVAFGAGVYSVWRKVGPPVDRRHQTED